MVSPLLANVYLHYAFDLWAARWRRREATGDMIIVRYADDIVVGFEKEAEARRFWDAMRARLREFSLSLHPEKTRLIEFGRFAAVTRRQRGLGKPETFSFLGFTFICGKSRQGHFQLKRKTRPDRMRAKLQELKEELRWRMHQPIPEQGGWLKQVVTGFFAYHAVLANGAALSAFRYHVTCLWRRSLWRRSQKDASPWQRVGKLADDWLPKPKILHPWPHQRFAVKHPRWEPYAGCVRRSWYELASASLACPKPSKQDGSEPCGRHGNVASEAWVAVGWGVGLTPEIGLLRRPSWRSHQRRQHIGSRQARGPVLRRGLRPGHVRMAHTGT